MDASRKAYRGGVVILAAILVAGCGGGFRQADAQPSCFEAVPEYGQCLIDNPGSNDLTPDCKLIADYCATLTDPADKAKCAQALGNCQLNIHAGKPPVHPQSYRCGKLYQEASEAKCGGKRDDGS